MFRRPQLGAPLPGAGGARSDFRSPPGPSRALLGSVDSESSESVFCRKRS